MAFVGLFGAALVAFGVLGIIAGVFYVLFDMARQRDWAYFFPVLFAVCVFGGLFLVAIAVSSIKASS